MLLIVHLASAQDPELPFRGGVAGGNASGKQNREVCSVLDGFNPFNGGRGSGMANFPVIQSNCQSVVNFSPFNGGLAGGMFYARDIRSACQSVSGFSAYSGGLSGGFEHRKRVYRNCEGPNSSIVRLEPQSVCEGDTILIVGTHLSRVDQVTFSNNVFTLDFLVVDSTEIRVKVPLGAVTGPVEVSGPDGTALSNTDLTISPLPEAAFSYSAIDGLKYAFSSASTNADAYFWDFGNGLTAQSANPEVEFESDGQYLITHIAYNDCGTDTTRELITISSVFTEKIENLNMIIRPNPFREDFQIQFSAHGKFELAVFDILGQLVSKEMIFATGKTEVNRNLGMCTPGTYLIRLSGEGIILSGKVIRLN